MSTDDPTPEQSEQPEQSAQPEQTAQPQPTSAAQADQAAQQDQAAQHDQAARPDQPATAPQTPSAADSQQPQQSPVVPPVAGQPHVTPQQPGQPPAQPTGQQPLAPQQPYGAPAQQPYGAPSQQPGAQQPAPYGTQPQQPYGATAQNPYATGQQNPYATAQNPYATAAPKAPMDPKLKKRIILWSSIAGGALVLIAAAAITISTVNTTVYGPGGQVQKYLDAIAAGDAKTANQIASPDKSFLDRYGSTSGDDATGDPRALLTNEVLKAADKRITNQTVSRTAVYGDKATVEVRYKLDGKSYRDTVQLDRTGKQAVFFDDWEIDSPLVGGISVYSGNAGSSVSVNGVTVEASSDQTLLAYPAVYAVAAPESKYLTGKAQDVALTSFSAGGGSAFVDLEIKPTDALSSEVQKQVVSMLEKCISVNTLDTTCEAMPSWQQTAFTNVGPVTWKLTSPPTVNVNGSGTSFYTSDGQIDATFDASRYGRPVETQSLSATYLSFSGTITIDKDDKVTVTFDE
ncbi:hypothetical protein [Plantibacter sp. YIM 135249]|uniref:hypothetical protein n=1 Tax=Plantibacter sp. YIM 135249 TaxID=3423918 RepID=UPI003D33A870